MRLNNLVRTNKKKIRPGRGIGSGKGKTSGRGHKGQKSRSGVSIKGFEGGQMPLYRRLPKRGFTSIFRKNFNAFNLIQIQSLIDKKKISSKDEISTDFLLKKRIIKKKLNGIKILGKGEIKTKLIINAEKASKNAIKKIEKSGGTINLIKLTKKKNNKDIIDDKKKDIKDKNKIKE